MREASYPVRTVDSWWRRLGEFLAEDSRGVIPPSDQERLRDRWEEIQKKDEELDDRLFIGLVGGTGVGKSTLTNALAGEEISRSGDRRPTTDRAVVYRHVDEELPLEFPRENLATPDRTHEIEELRRIIILDFPDFDSVQADHAAVLESCLPHLDLTFVVVDETKYGDKLLYETLGSFPQDPENLTFIFNKLDELEIRYGSSAPAVVEDLLGDLRRKVEKFVGWSPDRESVLALSARAALEAAREGRAVPEDFEALRQRLLEYRHEKRRLSAKAINLRELRARWIQELRSAYLDPGRRRAAAVCRERLERGARDTTAILAGIPRRVLVTGEKRALAHDRLGELRPRLGFPVDMILTFWGQWSWFRRKPDSPLPTMLSGRLAAHYRPVEEALEVYLKEYRQEAPAGLEPPSPDVVKDLTAHAGREADRNLASALEERLRDVLARRRLKNHLLPGITAGLFLWSIIQPPLAELVGSTSEGEGGSLGSFLGALIRSVIQGLNPFLLVGGVVLVAGLYLLSALIVSIRITQAVEASVDRVEGEAREAHVEALRELSARLEERLAAWEREYAELDEILEEGESVLREAGL